MTNIRSTTGANLVLKNGVNLGSSYTTVPVGYAGVAGDGGAALVAGAGTYNLDIPNDVSGLQQNLLNTPTTGSANVTINHRFTDDIRAFVDLTYQNNKSIAYIPGFATSTTLAANAPNNPFTSAVNVSFPVSNLVARSLSKSQTVGVTGGIIVKLGRGWSFSADHAWSRARVYTEGTLPMINAAGQAAVRNGLIDVMRDLRDAPLDFSAYLTGQPATTFGPADVVMNDTTARLSGSLMTLPGGKLTLTAQVERMDQKALGTYQKNTSAVPVVSYVYRPERSQRMTSAYGELRAPIFSEANDIPLLRRLEVQASVRYDHYLTLTPERTSFTLATRDAAIPDVENVRNVVSATRFTVGGIWSPVREIELRASYSTAFLPPSIAQLVSLPQSPSPTTVIDPLRGNTTYRTNIVLIQGGNPDIEPEDSKAFSAGVIFKPGFLPGFRVSADYTRISKSNEITSPTFQQVVDMEASLPGRVIRAAPSETDPAGYAGVITSIDQTLLNVLRTTVEAVDVQADYTLSTARSGEFSFYLIATWQPTFNRQSVLAAPYVNQVAFSNGPLEWRGNAGVNWTDGTFSAGWNMQYYDSYLVYSSTSSITARNTLIANQGTEHIPAQTYHDLVFSYRSGPEGMLGNPLLGRVTLQFGIQNIFDKSPPILATIDTAGGYSTYGDPRGRRFTLTVRKAF